MVKNALAAEIRGDYSAPKTPRWIEVGKSKRREGKETGEEVKGREKKGEKGWREGKEKGREGEGKEGEKEECGPQIQLLDQPVSDLRFSCRNGGCS